MKFTDMVGQHIVVDSPNGNIQGTVTDAVRGQGDQRYCVDLWIISAEPPPESTQCHVSINGKSWGCMFSHVLHRAESYRAKLSTIVADDPGFWEDS